jgi:Family of unknown function (DUF6510)
METGLEGNGLEGNGLEGNVLDGNVLGGMLGEVFAVDVTTAHAQCVSCGRTGAVGEVIVYVTGMGLVARCPGCEAVVLRVVRGPDRVWLDLRGVVSLELEVP